MIKYIEKNVKELLLTNRNIKFKCAYKKVILLSFLFTLTHFTFIPLSAMKKNTTDAITPSNTNPSNLVLKSLYIGTCVLGVSYLTYLNTSNTLIDAENRHDKDPESKAAVTFFFISSTGYMISNIVYNLLFNTSTPQRDSSRQRKIKHKKNIGWAQQKKIKAKTPYRKHARN